MAKDPSSRTRATTMLPLRTSFGASSSFGSSFGASFGASSSPPVNLVASSHPSGRPPRAVGPLQRRSNKQPTSTLPADEYAGNVKQTMATDTESVEFHQIQKMFTETPQVPAANIDGPVAPTEPEEPMPETQVLNSQAPSQQAAIPSAEGTQTPVQLPYYMLTQLYEGETQKDPDTSVDGNSQSQGRPGSNTPARPTSAGLEALVAEIEEEPEEKLQYYDESRRFDSPKFQRDETVTPRAPKLFGMPGSIRGSAPMGLTQLFNNTQASPLRPNAPATFSGFDTPLDGLTPRKSPLKRHTLPEDLAAHPEELSSPVREPRKIGRRLLRGGLSLAEAGEPGDNDKDYEPPADELDKVLEITRILSRKNARSQKEIDREVDGILGNLRKEKKKQEATNQGKEKKKDANAPLPQRHSSNRSLNDRTDRRPTGEKTSRSVDGRGKKRRSVNHSTSEHGSTTDEEEPLPLKEPKPHQNLSEDATLKTKTVPALPHRQGVEKHALLDWDSIHDIPKHIPKKINTSFLRKRASTSKLEESKEPRLDGPKSNETESGSEVLPPHKPGKSSIRNMPPFNIPLPDKPPALLPQSSTFGNIGSNLYKGSSSIPMPSGDDSLPLTSSPPISPKLTKQVEASSSPPPANRRQSDNEEIDSPALRTPKADNRLGLNRKSIIPGTSPSDRMGMFTPLAKASSLPPAITEGGGYTDLAQEVETPVQGKRKRINNPNEQVRVPRAESVIPCSLPEETAPQAQARDAGPALDAEGDTQMDELHPVSAGEGESNSLPETYESPLKKRKSDNLSQGSMKENVKKVGKLDENRRQVENQKSNSEPLNSKPATNVFKELKSQSSNLQKPKSVPRLKKVKAPHTPAPIITTPTHAQRKPQISSDNFNADAEIVTNRPDNSMEIDSHYRVFALFKDPRMYYYPATLRPSALIPKSQALVTFDDGTDAILDRSHVRRLDLRVGDVIKCDMPSMKSKLWIVYGFPERVEPQPDQDKLVDINGNSSVFLRNKPKVHSGGSTANTPAVEKSGTESEAPASETFEVPITRIYLLKSLWTQFQNRGVEDLSALMDDMIPQAAGSGRGSYTALDTPTSGRDRRPTPLYGSMSLSKTNTPVAAHKAKKGTPGLARTSITGVVNTGSVFSGMVFAISFGDNENEKKSITAKILSNGGTVLENDFEELFEPVDGKRSKTNSTAAAAAAVSDSEGGPEVQVVSGEVASGGGGTVGLKPRAEAYQYGFACVIADKFSRRVKFLQALALGIPCLASRWVDDCVKKNTIIDDWGMYLLPAGESSFLFGAIRSRVMQIFPASSTTFCEILDTRKQLLKGMRVLLVMGKGKQGEKRRPYWFLTAALGAKEIVRVASVEEAIPLLSAEKWDLVYADGSGAAKGRKEKSSNGKILGVHQQQQSSVRIVDDEWIVQSLILGRLVEE